LAPRALEGMRYSQVSISPASSGAVLMRSRILAHRLTSPVLPFLGRMVFSPKMETDILLMQEALAEARASASAGEVPSEPSWFTTERFSRVPAIALSVTTTPPPTLKSSCFVKPHDSSATIASRTQRSTSPSSPAACAPARSFRPASRARLRRRRPKGGAVRSCFEILSNPRLNHEVEVSSGILAAEAAAVLQSFFRRTTLAFDCVTLLNNKFLC